MDDERNPLDYIKKVDFKPPVGWRRMPESGNPIPTTVYSSKKLRLVVSEVLGALMVSISKQRRGRPGHPTDAQCKEVLDTFGLAGLEEHPMTSSARYFRPSTKGAS